jgi:predicted MFS family arabinose efflux permease
VLVSFAIMVPAIIAAERKDKMRPVFLAVGLLVVVQGGLYLLHESLWVLALWLLLFFVAFNVLEATLPSLVSRTAPPAAKGAALGVYNTTQAIGLFIGGAAGGYIAQHFGDNAVFAACTGLVLIWLAVASSMNFPRRRQAPPRHKLFRRHGQWHRLTKVISSATWARPGSPATRPAARRSAISASPAPKPGRTSRPANARK